MTDYYEIDLHKIDEKTSGDAISIRYVVNNASTIMVVDAGYQSTGKSVVENIKSYYDSPTYINHVVATHPDGDHAGGLRHVLEEFEVGELWMNRPWIYAGELISQFSRFTSVENLEARLREIYPNIAYLEEIALDKGIPIRDVFQGTQIGAFIVLSPTRERFLDLIVESERTPESVTKAETSMGSIFMEGIEKIIQFVKSAWGEEAFSNEDTSAENEMSVVQYAVLCEERILLTADAGRESLAEAIAYAPFVGIQLPGLEKFQVPHHGSRRNLSSEILDSILGQRLENQNDEPQGNLTALVSAALKDKDHPRKAVIRACIHRGARVISNQGQCIRTSRNAPDRDGWSPVTPLEYPSDQEE